MPFTKREALLLRVFCWVLRLAFAGATAIAFRAWLFGGSMRGLGGAMIFGIGFALVLWLTSRIQRTVSAPQS